MAIKYEPITHILVFYYQYACIAFNDIINTNEAPCLLQNQKLREYVDFFNIVESQFHLVCSLHLKTFLKRGPVLIQILFATPIAVFNYIRK